MIILQFNLYFSRFKRTKTFGVITCFCLITLLSCHSKKELAHNNFVSPKEITAKNIETAKIIFLSFKATQDTTSENLVIELLNKKIVEGKFKHVNDLRAKSLPNHLKLSFNDTEIYIEHPLIKTVDVYGDNYTDIDAQRIHLTSAEFFVRLELSGGSNSLTIFEFINGKQTKNIITLDLSN